MSIEAAAGWLIPLGVALTFASGSPLATTSRSFARAVLRTLGVLSAALVASAAAFAIQEALWPPTAGLASHVSQLGGFAIGAGIAAGFGVTNRRSAVRMLAGAAAALIVAFLAPAMREGWLAQLGALANLGHGAVDLSGLALVGLVGGGCATACNAIFRGSALAPELPKPPLAFAAFDSLLLIAGVVAVVAGLPESRSTGLFTAQLLGLGLVLGSALAMACVYGWFTTGRIQAAMISRALIAALFAASSAALLPAASAIVLGVSVTLIAIPVGHWLQARHGVRDGHGAAGAMLLPAALGAVWTGLFANGAFLAGWGGIGADAYLNHAGLGVVGWLIGGDIGQFSAQIVLTCVAAGLGLGIGGMATIALRQLAPALCVEANTDTQQLDIRRPQAKPGQQTIDGGAPAHSLPKARAYRVAYPFRTRVKRDTAAQEAPRFVVADDEDAVAPQP